MENLPARLAVDFGTSNTMLAAWDERRQEGVPLPVPDFGRWLQSGTEQFCIVPSLIHYSEDGLRWIGQQVVERGLSASRGTFRWMKRYIASRSPAAIRIGDQPVTYRQAGSDFLASILAFANPENLAGVEEVALTVPVEAFEHYENWLSETAARARLPRFRLIDEPSAAALGYGAHIRPGSVYLIFDFGGGTLDVSVVLVESEQDTRPGRRCRVLGKAGMDFGGATIDGWIFQEVLQQNGVQDGDEDVRAASTQLLVQCERVKEELSFQESSTLSLPLASGKVLQAAFTPLQLEQLLDHRDAFTGIERTLRRALNAARERGYSVEEINTVLMVGGSSQIPSIQQYLRRIFGRERVMLNRPLDAIARGAAAFIAGVDFYDHIQHDYAIRHLSREKGDYDFRLLVEHGTPYPTPGPVARLTVKASYDGQTRLGLAIFELGERQEKPAGQRMELVFDPSGAARLHSLTPEEEQQRSLFWMNENSQTFLQADPPAARGEPRFEVAFAIDENKRLTVTARDLIRNELVLREYPVVKLV